MTGINEDIRQAKEVVEKAYQNALSSSKKYYTPEESKSKVIECLDELFKSVKKTSEEGKYIVKLQKEFSDSNYESIKFYIESNYDRFDEIHSIITKFDENFEDKERKRYEAKHSVLKSLNLYLIEKGI